MKVAVLRNTPSAQVLQALGRRNREYYREEDIAAACDALRLAGHDARVFEADIDLIGRLEEFFGPRGSAGYCDAFVFNMAYGVQGDCRYTHVPSILEWAGLPYVGSGPHAHTVCLDKQLSKAVFAAAGLPTPPFQLFTSADEPRSPSLGFPLIAKPQFESTSFGVKVVANADELRQAVGAILSEFRQPVLVEAFIDGMEVNCGVVGNDPPEALPVLEVDFGPRRGTAAILTYEVKRDRVATHVCPARIPDELTKAVQRLAVAAFRATGCRDAARIDFRIDRQGVPQILEINSMVAIHEHGSLYHAARTLGMSHPELVLKVFNAAVARTRRN